MIVIRSANSPTTLLSCRLILVLSISFVCLGVWVTGPAHSQEHIGIFWDDAYTHDSTITSTIGFPHILTGYVVLKDPSTSSGLTGWEACAEVDGPGIFLSWTLEGSQASNFSSEPCFKVGIGGVPLPTLDDALLATFQVMVTEYLPVTLSLTPDSKASLPGEMSYTPADDPGSPRPMTTVTGQPEAGWINRYLFDIDVDPGFLAFDNIFIGTQSVRNVTVTNYGTTPKDLDISLTGDCGPFTLPGLSGSLTVPVGESRVIEVAFTPLDEQNFSCNLNLGAAIGEVSMTGNGRAPWALPSEVDFGLVGFNVGEIRTVTIRNIGGPQFTIVPSIPLSCPEFTITSGDFPVTLSAFSETTIEITFLPVNPGEHACQLDLGSLVPAVQLTGFGTDPGNGWEISPNMLEFGNVEVDTIEELAITILNIGETPLPVAPDIPNECLGYTVDRRTFSIDPGDSATITVSFNPHLQIHYYCSLDLGDVLPDVPLHGLGVVFNPIWNAPTSHDFGSIGLGQSRTWSFNVKNTGVTPFLLDPEIINYTESFHITWGGGQRELYPGVTTGVSVDFIPLEAGHHSVVMDMGPTVTAIYLEGESFDRPGEWSVTPDPLDFSFIFLGSNQSQTVTINNSGGTYLDLDISLDNPGPEFSITSGAGVHQLIPGSTHQVEVLFESTVPGEFETTLILGPEVAPVPVTGAAESTTGACVAQPHTLFFGPLASGGTQTLDYYVTNNSNQELKLYPRSNQSVFRPLVNVLTLGAGQTTTLEIEFLGPAAGRYTGTLTLGKAFCSEVDLVGDVTPQAGSGQNLVGIFFDQGYTSIEAQTSSPNEIVESYLVMIEPSETSGVSAWELRMGIDGDAQWLGWDLEGQAINAGEYNDFIVGIGGSPLPYSPAVLLATGQLLVTNPYPNVVYLELMPIWNASIPDQMVWALGDDASMLLPLLPYTGEDIVAGVNWSSTSAVEIPLPPATTRLLPNVPNPFNPMTEIRFELAKPQQVRVTIYDVTGRRVKVLAEGHMQAGPHTRIWQGRDSAGRQVPSGVYYVRMVAGDKIDHQKVMLLK
jgi:hypothetical protein